MTDKAPLPMPTVVLGLAGIRCRRLHSPEIKIIDKSVGEAVGSEHYPVIIDFSL